MTFHLSKMAPFDTVTDLKVGERIHFQLIVQFPPGTTDIQVTYQWMVLKNNFYMGVSIFVETFSSQLGNNYSSIIISSQVLLQLKYLQNK